MKKICSILLVLFMTIVFFSCNAEGVKKDISEFDAAQYVTGTADSVDIYAGFSFGMFAEQAIVEARKAGVYVEQNPYSSGFDVYTPNMVLIEEYYDAELHYYFGDDGTQLLQLMCVFNSPSERVYNAIEKILVNKYGETPYTSVTGNSIGQMSFSAIDRNVFSTEKCPLYSQRVVQLSDGTYVLVDHHIWNDFWPLHYLEITIINPKN